MADDPPIPGRLNLLMTQTTLNEVAFLYDSFRFGYDSLNTKPFKVSVNCYKQT